MKDLTNMKFGKLIAIRPTNQRCGCSIIWECRCECGEKAFVSSSNLTQNHTKSCGCINREKVMVRNNLRIKDLKGQRFGKVVVIDSKFIRNSNNAIQWKCKCDCGTIKYILASNLSRTVSCGCMMGVNASKLSNITTHIKKVAVGGTRLDLITSNTINKNNTTGFRGVSKRKRDGKYVSYINFQGKRYFLGSYNSKDEAFVVRQVAEDKLYNSFIHWYNENHSNKNTTPR